MATPRHHPLGTLGLFVFGAVLLSACDTYPKTPDLALAQIEHVVISGDGAQAWTLVDPATRSLVTTLFADERELKTRLASQPQDASTKIELARIAAVDEPTAAAFFVRTCQIWKLLESFRKRLGSTSGPIQKREDGPGSVWVARFDGMAFHVVKSGAGWAWADVKGEWKIEAERVQRSLQKLRPQTGPHKNEGP